MPVRAARRTDRFRQWAQAGPIMLRIGRALGCQDWQDPGDKDSQDNSKLELEFSPAALWQRIFYKWAKSLLHKFSTTQSRRGQSLKKSSPLSRPVEQAHDGIHLHVSLPGLCCSRPPLYFPRILKWAPLGFFRGSLGVRVVVLSLPSLPLSAWRLFYFSAVRVSRGRLGGGKVAKYGAFIFSRAWPTMGWYMS